MGRKGRCWKCDDRRGRDRSRHPGEGHAVERETGPRRRGPAPPDVWDVFDLGEETVEPEPEYGDFWLEAERFEDVC